MSIQSAYRELVSRVNLEYALLLVMLVSSTYMLWESYNFRIGSAATFPRLTGGFVLIGTLLLLFQSYLPEPLYSFVAESADLIDVDDDELMSGEAEEPAEMGIADGTDSSEESNEVSSVGRPIHDSIFTIIATVGYGLLAYAIGIMWASPLFVLIYGLWFKLSWKSLLILIPLSLLIGYGFYEALGLRVDRGNLFFTEGLL